MDVSETGASTTFCNAQTEFNDCAMLCKRLFDRKSREKIGLVSQQANKQNEQNER